MPIVTHARDARTFPTFTLTRLKKFSLVEHFETRKNQDGVMQSIVQDLGPRHSCFEGRLLCRSQLPRKQTHSSLGSPSYLLLVPIQSVDLQFCCCDSLTTRPHALVWPGYEATAARKNASIIFALTSGVAYVIYLLCHDQNHVMGEGPFPMDYVTFKNSFYCERYKALLCWVGPGTMVISGGFCHHDNCAVTISLSTAVV